MTRFSRRPSHFGVLMLFGAALLIAGCESGPPPEVVNDPVYKAGYADGCQTAHSRVEGFGGTVHRNEELFKTDETYRAGWRNGYGACGGAGGSSSGGIFDNSSGRQPWEPGRF